MSQILTAADANALLQLTQRVQITGNEALPVALLQQKLANIAQASSDTGPATAAAPETTAPARKTRKPRKAREGAAKQE